MKNKILIGAIVSVLGILYACDSNTFDEISSGEVVADTISYERQVRGIIETRCVFCHSPSGRASSAPLTNYQEVSRSIDRIVDLIQRPAGDPFRMPPSGMPITEINTIVEWRNKGIPEK